MAKGALVEIVRGHLPFHRTHDGGADRGAARRAPVGRRGGAGAASSWTGGVLRGRFLSAPGARRRRPVVRAPPARADQPPHARRPPPRDRAGQRRRLPALPVRLAKRPPREPAPRAAGARARHRAAAGLRGRGRRLGAGDSPGARSRATTPAWLDALCLSGGVAWGRLAARPAGGTPSRAAPIALCRRADLPWLLAPETERARRGGAVGARPRRPRPADRRAGRASSTRSSRDAPPPHRGRGRARRAGLRGAGHRRRVLRPARAHLGDADPRRRPRALALPLEPPHRRRRSAPAAGRCLRGTASSCPRATRESAARRGDPPRGARSPVHQAIWRRVP